MSARVRKAGPQGKRGVALLLVLAALAILTVLSFEILFATRVDLRIGRNARDRMQAYYLALSASRLSLLRLQMYKEIRNMVDGGTQLPIPAEVIDRIWSTPLPQMPLAGMEVDWPGTIMGTISSEGSKIPVNLLDGNVHRRSGPEVAKQVRDEIGALIKGLLEDEEFDKLYRGLKPEDLIDPLQDWLDADGNRTGGGDENSDYEKLDRPYRPRNDRIPSLSEMHLIKGWTDDLYQRIAPSLSVLNLSLDVNPNYIPRSRLKAIYPRFTEEELSFIEQHRMITPFKDLADMAKFINSAEEIKSTRQGGAFSWPSTMKDSARQEIFVLESSGIVGEAKRSLRMGIRFLSEPAKKATPAQGQAATGAGAQEQAPEQGTNAKKPGKLLEPVVVSIEEAL